MGYRGKVREQEAARVLRAEGRTLADIAATLGVSKSSVSLGSATSPSRPHRGVTAPNADVSRSENEGSARSKSSTIKEECESERSAKIRSS
jgi:hypothetical protein